VARPGCWSSLPCGRAALRVQTQPQPAAPTRPATGALPLLPPAHPVLSCRLSITPSPVHLTTRAEIFFFYPKQVRGFSASKQHVTDPSDFLLAARSARDHETFLRKYTRSPARRKASGGLRCVAWFLETSIQHQCTTRREADTRGGATQSHTRRCRRPSPPPFRSPPLVSFSRRFFFLPARSPSPALQLALAR